MDNRIDLHVDVETYSGTDLGKSGVYPYVEDPAFEVMLLAFRVRQGGRNKTPTICLDLVNHQAFVSKSVADMDYLEEVDFYHWYWKFEDWYHDPKVRVHAHNAMFERNTLAKAFGRLPVTRFRCNMIRAAYAGMPLRLEELGEALGLDKKKMGEGKALIRLFCVPCKPTKANGFATRETRETRPDKWANFIKYCIRDVDVEIGIGEKLGGIHVPEKEYLNYFLDQEINDRGVLVDVPFVKSAIRIRDKVTESLMQEMRRLTNLDNPNSLIQLKEWLHAETGTYHESFNKEVIDDVMESVKGHPKAKKVMDIRNQVSSTSVKKYDAFLECVGSDNRVRGLYQHYGANRTGRTSGRLVQPQNLTRNKMPDLDEARGMVMTGDAEMLDMMYDDPLDTLSQLIRTSIIAPEGKVFAVLDYSSIEARVIANLAQEKWRLDVFHTHGKIYETSASRMFKVPIEECGKGTDYRDKGKIAELACGFQGGYRAMDNMQGDAGIPKMELKQIVNDWRQASPNIVALWEEYGTLAATAILTRKAQVSRYHNVVFSVTGEWMRIRLPSGRDLHFYQPQAKPVERFGRRKYEVSYKDKIANRVGMWRIPTYGGHLVQGVVQGTARDLLFEGMQRAAKRGYEIVMHTHDEAIFEVDERTAERDLEILTEVLSEVPSWFQGVPLPADGFITKYYKKDD